MGGRQVEEAMARLGDEQRALVELSVVRGISDEEIGGYLGIDAGRVAQRRDAALDALVADAGDGLPDDRDRVVAVLQGEPEPEPEPEPAPEPEPEPAPEPVLDTRPLSEALPATAPEVRFRPVPILIIGLALAAITVLVLVLGRTDDTVEPSGSPAQTAREGMLAPLLPGGTARGTARITTGDAPRLQLSARGLPAPDNGGGYVVWLYNDVTDARSLSGALRGSFRVNAPLPKDYRRYRYVDISREPADGNRNHSGQSVLRVPLRSIGSN